ncbi:hypothetical protein MLD38_010289 [Melastoma candidum]|uniref:Uncharacterized protein n=1 Tax=Melastoma candidum TaxID=119954 RepID=A0ACB9QYR8_9MYRT|nr:hypothetical protein MLD38_010289 [Melastoma candidum]
MALRTCDPKFPFSYGGCFDTLNAYKRGFDAGAGSSISQSLVVDSEKGGSVNTSKSSRAVKKSATSEEKARAALKNHCEAERRRREGINSHLATLRGLVPCTVKMDKATLLAEVIGQIKDLKKKATEASGGLLIPMDADDVTVELIGNALGDGCIYFKATVCCEHHPELFRDLGLAVDSLNLKITRAEVSMLENRLKNVFVISSSMEELAHDQRKRHALARTIHEELSSVVAKASGSPDYSPNAILSSKKRRITSFDSSSASS